MRSTKERRWIAAVVAVAFLLRLFQSFLRWDEIALAYAAYQEPFVATAQQGDLLGLMGTYYGLHPPLYSLFFLVLGGLWGAPAAWLLFSAAVSAAAVWWVGLLGGIAAAAILAVDPLQIAYAGEVNNYPLLVCWVAMMFWATEHAVRGRGIRWLVLSGILAAWTHILGAVVLGVCLVRVLLRNRREALQASALCALGILPVAWKVWGLIGSGSTYGQEGLDWSIVGAGIHDKVGLWWLIILPASVAAWSGRRVLALQAAALFVVILVLIAAGVAAPHQQPYWLILGPPIALLVGSLPKAVPWLVAAAGLFSIGPELSSRMGDLREDLSRERAIDLVLTRAGESDAIWLVAPALEPDDDKRATSDVLWRFSPFSSAPAWRGPDDSFDFADPRYGQPRVFGQRVVHSSVDVVQGTIEEGCQRVYEEAEAFRESVGWHLEANRRVWVVLYNHSPACDMLGGLRWAMKPFLLADLSPADPSESCMAVGEDRGLGRDWLCVIEGRRE